MKKAKAELNSWISKDRLHVADGLSGNLDDLQGVEAWTSSPSTCLDIQDMDVGDQVAGAVVATVPDDDDEE